MAALGGTGRLLPFVERLNNKHASIGPLASGLLGALSQTTWAPSAIGVFAFAPLFATLPRSSVRGAFARGFCAAFVMVALSRSFVFDAASLAFDSAVHGVLALVAVALLHAAACGATCVLAVALGSNPWLAGFPGSRSGAWTLATAVVLATLVEMFVPLPLPYPIGMSLEGLDATARGAAVFGVYGLSAACYASSASLASLFLRQRTLALSWSGPASVLLVVLAGFVSTSSGDHAAAPTLRLRIESGDRRRGEVPTFAEASADVALTVFPESLLPETLSAADVPALVHRLAGEHGPLLFATNVLEDGALRNRAFLLSGDGAISAVSDKRVLIPLAEGPLAALIFHDSSPHDVLIVDGTRVATTICYEGLFPTEARARLREHGATVHINLANDGWFSDSRPIEAQVRALRLRAIENGVATVRVSNGGTSAAFLPDGALAWRGDAGSIETLEIPTHPRRTIFSRAGSLPVLLLLALIAAAATLSGAAVGSATVRRGS